MRRVYICVVFVRRVYIAKNVKTRDNLNKCSENITKLCNVAFLTNLDSLVIQLDSEIPQQTLGCFGLCHSHVHNSVDEFCSQKTPRSETCTKYNHTPSKIFDPWSNLPELCKNTNLVFNYISYRKLGFFSKSI